MKKSLRRIIENTIDAVINSIWFEELRFFDVPIRPFIHPVIATLILISGFTVQDPVWKAAVAAMFFFLIPEIIGGGILSTIELIREEKGHKNGLLENWAVGAATLLALFFLITLFSPALLRSILIILVAASLIARLVLPYFEHTKSFKTVDYDEEIRDRIIIVLAAMILSLIGFAVWRSNSPYPLPLNWDLYEHQTLVNEIRSGNLHFLNSRISDSFIVDGYSPLFHILLTAPQIIISEARILGFWWFVEFLQYFLTIAASAFLAWRLTKDRLTAIIMAILSAFTFESFISYSPLFLIPQTFASVLVILALTRGLKRLEKKLNFFDPLQILLAVVILLTHYIVGSLGILVLLTAFAAHKLEKQKLFGVKTINVALAGSIFILIFLPVITYYFDIEILQYPEAQHFNLDLARKWELMRNWYGYSLLAFVPIGLFAFLRHPEFISGSKRPETEKMLNQVQHDNLMGKSALTICLGTLTLVIAKIPYSLKFYALSGFFVHFLMAAGLAVLLHLINSKILKAAFLIITILSFGLIFTLNQKYYKGILHYGEYTTQLSINEMKAAYWLEENYGRQKGVILISDPATQGIMEALSGINSQGGVCTNLATRRVIDQTYPNSDSKQIASLLFSIQDTVKKEKISKVLFVVSGRFFKWQEASTEEKEAVFFNVWRPADLSPQDKRYVNALRLNPKFQPVYQNPGLVIFEVRK